MSGLTLKNVKKYYGKTAVIPDLTLEIRSGEFLVLVGPSGCGKSTLLRMIAGLDGLSDGTIHIEDTDVTELPAGKRGLSMVFQSYALYPHMTVRQNLAFGLKNIRTPPAEIARRISEAALILRLDEMLDRLPQNLSGGQRQRVAMGRAIVREPSVFLFDEPLSNLDAQLRVQMRTEIKALHQRLKSTVIYVTHDQIEAMSMADRIVVMNQGKIQQIGAPLELYDHPANKFVAGFIGSPSMSFISGSITQDGFFRTSEGEGIAVPGHAKPGSAAEMGIRPENFVVAPDGKGLSLAIEVVEQTGPETHVYGRIAGEAVRAVFRERIHLAPGERVPVTARPEQIHLFDKESGLPL